MAAINKIREYQICKKCVMDTTDTEISFNEDGICNHCIAFQNNFKVIPKENYITSQLFWNTVDKIKQNGKKKEFDCILGLSGGTDSSYLSFLCKEANLRPLVVHFDNGWNTETAVRNIEKLVNKLNFELFTYVINWEEFRDLQLSYFRASVIDLEVPTDHLIFGSLYKIAKKFGVHDIISGYNLSSEGIMPMSWIHMKKFDRENMKDIHKKFGTGTMKHLPTLGVWQRIYYQKIYKFKQHHLLQTFGYNKSNAKNYLINNLEWVDYGHKHFESVFTRFYQGYFLPKKFNVDKRKAHLSTLINSQQLTREEAIIELSKPTYDVHQQENDIQYVCKKWQITRDEFDTIMSAPPRKHSDFKEEIELEKNISKIATQIKKIPIIGTYLKNKSQG